MSKEVIPFAWYDQTSNCFFKDKDDAPACAQVWPLYLQSDKREWVGLTSEEIREGNRESWVTTQAWESAVWWAEAKLKEKNG